MAHCCQGSSTTERPTGEGERWREEEERKERSCGENENERCWEAGGFICTLRFSARAGSIDFSGYPLPAEITSWKERSLSWEEGQSGDSFPFPLGGFGAIWVGDPLGNCPTDLSLNPTSTTDGSDLRQLTSPSELHLPPLHIGINDALPCGL